MRYKMKRKYNAHPPQVRASEGSINPEVFFGGKFSRRHIRV
jgi:hypothetical protein